MTIFLEILTAIADVFAIFASAIAIYLFLFKREVISSIFKVLLNYSAQITFTELNGKLERLNDLVVEDQDSEVINILSEILGQINGNKYLSKHFIDSVPMIKKYVDGKQKITEPGKRFVICDLRERLRHINVENYAEFIGE